MDDGPDKVVIAIQARSTSERLPNKCMALINGTPMVERVINAVQSSASFINNGRGNVMVQTCLLVPEGDPIARKYQHKIITFEGSEHDVLSRYKSAADKLEAHYVTRITSDCPMIPAFLITKHILCATKHSFDYTSNVDPEVRTAPDGFDCEVLSKRLLDYISENVKTPLDKEHVTTYARKHKPVWGRYANVVSYTDNSHLKLSVDTAEDLEFVRTYDQIIEKKIKISKATSEGFFRI